MSEHDCFACDESLVLLGGSPEEQRDFARAFIGITWRDNVKIAVYDRDAVVSVYVERDGMSRSEAEEFFEFNTAGAYVGEQNPIFVSTGGHHTLELLHSIPHNGRSHRGSLN